LCESLSRVRAASHAHACLQAVSAQAGCDTLKLHPHPLYPLTCLHTLPTLCRTFAPCLQVAPAQADRHAGGAGPPGPCRPHAQGAELRVEAALVGGSLQRRSVPVQSQDVLLSCRAWCAACGGCTGNIFVAICSVMTPASATLLKQCGPLYRCQVVPASRPRL
jgi:hypothetical protein